MKLLLVLAVALLPAPSLPKTLVFEHVLVTAAEPGVGCGIRKTWSMVEFGHDGATDRAWLECGRKDNTPKAGAHCTITVSVAAIDTHVPGKPNPFTGYAIDEMACDPPLKD